MPTHQVPAATRTLQVLRFLAGQPEPVTLAHLAQSLGIPRSSAYHLLNAMIAEGFVSHLDDDHRYGLGVSAFEVGSGYARHTPLQRVARRLIADLVDHVGESGHLAVLHGREVFYVLEERAPGRRTLVSDVGVRLPAHVTASGRAILAQLPAAQVRALFPGRDAFVSPRGTGPRSLSELNSVLAMTRQRGHATEDGEVTPGLSSVACAVLDHVRHPVAGVAVTFETSDGRPRDDVVARVAETSRTLSLRLGGRPPAAESSRHADVGRAAYGHEG